MGKKEKTVKTAVPEDFTLALALTDALPVLFFAGSMFIGGKLLGSIPFFIGGALCFWAGAAKVLWKIIVVTKKKNVRFLFLQMRAVMPVGFVLICIALVIKINAIGAESVLEALTSLPSLIFFITGIVGLALMSAFAFLSDASDARSNWIEQLTNTAAQAAFFAGLLFLLR